MKFEYFDNKDYEYVIPHPGTPRSWSNYLVDMQTQGWCVMAETMQGHGGRAHEYLRAYLPAAYHEKAETREIKVIIK
jgi:cellobiose phosphorylase